MKVDKVEIVKKKKWLKPLLIILERSTPDEAILANCKRQGGTGPNTADCKQTPANCYSNPNS